MSTFLFVHNEPEFYEKATDYFQEKGHEVQTITTCLSTTSLLKKQIFDVILFDTAITDCNASQLTKIVQNINKNTILIVAVEKETASEIIKGIDTDIYDFIQKPFGMNELSVKVGGLMEKTREKTKATRPILLAK